jgi:hypothetical protein
MGFRVYPKPSKAREFVERYRDRYRRAVEVFAQGLGEALTYLDFPSGPPAAHQEHQCAGAAYP